MEIIEVKEKEIWDQYLDSREPYSGSFLQSWEWGEFQESIGRKFWRFGLLEEGNLEGLALIVKHDLPLGKSYLYCPRGPVLEKEFDLFISKVKEIAKEEKAIFFRVEPEGRLVSGIELKKTKAVQPADTLMLDLGKSEDKLLADMKQKARYNIRLAKRKGVTVRIGNQEKDLEIFIELLKLTASRDKFKTHPEGYYMKMFKTLEPLGLVKLFMAEFKGKIIGANFMMFFSKVATYLHGASDYHYRDVMAPHLLHWQAIQEAMQRGYQWYDFWGIAPEDNPNHPWAGISRFKKGFGGREFNFPGTLDIPFQNFWYNLYQVGKKVR